MTGRLQHIEDRLAQLGPGEFQNICDAYLVRREGSLASFNRFGSQLGKAKTKAGTPDSLFHMENGELRYIEFTSQADGLATKIIEDIDKCLNTSLTGIDKTEIDKVIICFNSRLKPADEHMIFEHARSNGVRIELLGLEWLSIEILTKYFLLANEFLGISLDTGQILPLENFIAEYNNMGGMVATPLDNKFFNRTKELDQLINSLRNTDIVILEGAPGVGKTKLALEAINHFLNDHKDYDAFVIAKKDVDIYNDLRIQLEADKNYLLLVDDANRQQANFQQLLGIFREKRKGSIKIILTVRNYALEEVLRECNQYNPVEINIPRFTDEEIRQIISDEFFGKINKQFQDRIIEIAEGNPRLAIMAARVAKEKQSAFLNGSVSDLYDAYFDTFIRDSDIFTNTLLLKTLGLIAFFFTIDRSDKVFVRKMTEIFDIDYYQFHEALDTLHKRELVEIQFNTARISEQVMATYFFFLVFIKKELLSFRQLLFTYFPEWKKRFSDNIIPSHNMFGQDIILQKISHTLDEYQASVENDPAKMHEYFSFFWFFKRTELLGYYYKRIQDLPQPEEQNYTTSYEMNAFSWDRDDTLEQLARFYPYPVEEYGMALDLSFFYCKKVPGALPELIFKIRENIKCDISDEVNGFQRQSLLMQKVCDSALQGEKHYIASFFALAPTFLSHNYQITKSKRNNAIQFYFYKIPLNEPIKSIRKKIWETFAYLLASEKAQVKEAIVNFKPASREPDINIWIYDLDFYLPLLDNVLESDKITDVESANQFFELMEWIGINDERVTQLKEKFNNSEFEYMKKLEWDFSKGKQNPEVKNFEDFRKHKTAQLREGFVIDNIDSAAPLLKAIHNLQEITGGSGNSVQQSLDIILDENFIRNPQTGFALLEEIMADYPQGAHVPATAIRSIVNSTKENTWRLLELVKRWENSKKELWLLTIFALASQDFIDPELTTEFHRMFTSLTTSIYLALDEYLKYEPYWPTLIFDIVTIVIEKNKKNNLRINLPFDFFTDYADKLRDHLPLLHEAYIQQEEISDHFDYGKKDLRKLVSIDPPFLYTYIQWLYPEGKYEHRDSNDQMSFIWQLNLPVAILEQTINHVIDNSYGFMDHDINMFFKNLSEEDRKRAIGFLFAYAEKYFDDESKLNAIVNVFKHSLPDEFPEFVKWHLARDKTLEAFQKIWWISQGGVYSGDVIIGQIHADEWQKVLSIVSQIEPQMDMLPIISYIKTQISAELKSAELERQRKFSNPNW
nr:hypothetical protein [uncultured Sediminibacterium sp.]